MSWPRGSSIRPVRIQSNSLRKCCRRSLMLAPCSCGPPPITTRTGLPQVCASTQLKVNFAIVDPVRADPTARLASAVICPNWIQYATLRTSWLAACLQRIADFHQQLFARGRRCRRRRRRFLTEPVDLLHQDEYRERYNQEVNDRVDEDAVIDRDRACILRRLQGC